MSLNDVIIFAVGASIGSVITWKLVKTKYENIANEEIKEIRDYYYGLSEKKFDADEDFEFGDEEDQEYNDILDSNGYRDYSGNGKKENKEEENVDKPYVISPEEFDDNEDYETVSLTYYSDGILTDERDNVIEDVEGTIGEDSLTHFGEYEDDSVFVRDDRKKIDYEILADDRKFSEVYRSN